MHASEQDPAERASAEYLDAVEPSALEASVPAIKCESTAGPGCTCIEAWGYCASCSTKRVPGKVLHLQAVGEVRSLEGAGDDVQSRDPRTMHMHRQLTQNIQCN